MPNSHTIIFEFYRLLMSFDLKTWKTHELNMEDDDRAYGYFGVYDNGYYFFNYRIDENFYLDKYFSKLNDEDDDDMEDQEPLMKYKFCKLNIVPTYGDTSLDRFQ